MHKGRKDCYWAEFTKAQIDAVYEVARAIHKEYGLKFFTGHCDIDKRKIDPGPLLSAKEFERDIFGQREFGRVTSETLNCRTMPHEVSKRTLAGRSPLAKGDIVQILTRDNGWMYVYDAPPPQADCDCKNNPKEEQEIVPPNYFWVHGSYLDSFYKK